MPVTSASPKNAWNAIVAAAPYRAGYSDDLRAAVTRHDAAAPALLVEGMIRLMDSGDDVTGPINVGNPGEFTMIELAEAVLKLTGSKSKLVRLPLPADDPKQRKPDITKAKSVLGWEPKVQLEDGLKETIAYFRKLLDE